MKGKSLPLLIIAGILMTAAIAVAESAENEKEAIAAAGKWLMLVDGGNYKESWETAASYFRQAVTPDQWIQSALAVRGPLGSLVSRQVSSVTYATSLPGAPDGQYVVIMFKSVFEHKAAAIETVTPMKDQDGQWRVSGYYIR